MSGYDKQYYDEHLGNDYHKEEQWLPLFQRFADHIVEDFAPKTVLDIGCAFGYMVKYLRDRGVEAWGIDTSSYAISQADEKIKPYLRVLSACEPLPEDMPQKYDLVINIEVLEHMTMEDGDLAISKMCTYADKILFSSTAEDFDEPTHINVQQPAYWVTKFAKQGFYKNLQYDMEYLSKYAMQFEKKQKNILEIIFDYEHLLQQNKIQKHDSFSSKIYFNMGDGESEDNIQLLTGYASELFNHRIDIPQGCKSIRFDPMEGSGCLIWNLQLRGDSQILGVSKHNGILLGTEILFSTIDPQLYIPLYEHCHWVEITAEIVPMNQNGWLSLYDDIINQQKNITMLKDRTTNMQVTIDDKSKAILDLEHVVDDKSKTISELEDIVSDYLDELKPLKENQKQQAETLESLKNENDALKHEIQDYSNLVAHERNEAKAVYDAYMCIQNSTCWKITKPLRVFLDFIKKLLRPFKKVLVSIHIYGLKTTLKKIKYKLKREPIPTNMVVPVYHAPVQKKNPLSDITQNPVDPIETIIIDEPVKRLNLVTDTIDAHSLLGGVATALIVATEFANRYNYELRIITRNSHVSPTNYYKIMEISDIKPAEKVSFYSDFERHNKAVDYKLDISKDDIFFATSWWSAKAISETTIRKRFFYIIQEVETFFYNFGPEHLLCSQMMQHEDIDYIINSGYLYEYFSQHNKHIVENGCYFEPAFPEKLYKKNSFAPKTKYKLFFYARPNNPRNLYSIGVYMLNRAVERGILDTNEWEIYCAGQNAPVIEFSNGTKSNNLGQLSWTEYAEFLTDVDLGLCLMYTPHPSYPPFDVACSGGVVLTNKMMNKTSFDCCKNVILADLEEEAFMDAFVESIALAKNMQERKKNYESNKICRSWHNTLQETIEDMGGKI